MFRNCALILFFCLVASGCSGGLFEDTSLPDVGGSSGVITWSAAGSSNPGIDQASVFHMGTTFVIWSDLPNGGGGGTSTNMHGVSCSGRLLGADGEMLKYQCESKDGKTGTAIIDGKSYDLTRGSLFLVSKDRQTIRVKQLTRDLNTLSFNEQGLRAFAREDNDIEQL